MILFRLRIVLFIELYDFLLHRNVWEFQTIFVSLMSDYRFRFYMRIHCLIYLQAILGLLIGFLFQ